MKKPEYYAIKEEQETSGKIPPFRGGFTIGYIEDQLGNKISVNFLRLQFERNGIKYDAKGCSDVYRGNYDNVLKIVRRMNEGKMVNSARGFLYYFLPSSIILMLSIAALIYQVKHGL